MELNFYLYETSQVRDTQFKGSNDTLKMCSFFSFYLLPLMDANSEISHCLRLRVILKYP